MDVLIEFEKQPLFFTAPQSVIRCTDPAKLDAAFQDIEAALEAGFYVAGFISYEAGYCFEKCLNEAKEYTFPLLQMGVYKQPLPETRQRPTAGSFNVGNFHWNISPEDYASSIEKIRQYIAEGEVYQITYCMKLLFSFDGDPRALYTELLRQQPVPYPAYIKTDDFHILSLSPERFIKKMESRAVTEPMKGTWPCGGNVFADAVARMRFSYDVKNRAENVMIADLLRNDLGRVGTNVRAPKLFTVTKYRTLFQMTSTVTGEIPRNILMHDLFAALFPSGSVTGAPKIRAMEYIRGLEQEERKIYTGAIGYIAPNRDLYFNVPIRTLLLSGGQGEMGVGGGIVWDSTPQGEWAEGLLKARFLTQLASPRESIK